MPDTTCHEDVIVDKLLVALQQIYGEVTLDILIEALHDVRDTLGGDTNVRVPSAI